MSTSNYPSCPNGCRTGEDCDNSCMKGPAPKRPPKIVGFTVVDGGHWWPWPLHSHGAYTQRGGEIFAIRFENGFIWDPITGYRKDPAT